MTEREQPAPPPQLEGWEVPLFGVLVAGDAGVAAVVALSTFVRRRAPVAAFAAS